MGGPEEGGPEDRKRVQRGAPTTVHGTALLGGSGVGAPKESSAPRRASVARLRNSPKATMLDAHKKNGLRAGREDHPEAGLLGRFKGSTASLSGRGEVR